MPMGDGTGPAGYGPRTGRGAGYCNGFNAPGSYRHESFEGRFGGRFGGGFGRRTGGRGRFAGGRQGWNVPPMGVQRITDDEYKGMLSEEAEYLERRLSDIKSQLDSGNSETE